jgi:DNA polymerase-4
MSDIKLFRLQSGRATELQGDASDLEKPGGITVLTTADIPTRIWPLAVRKVNGIGPTAGAKLDTLGIRTIGELAAARPESLVDAFGRSFGQWMHEAAHGPLS